MKAANQDSIDGFFLGEESRSDSKTKLTSLKDLSSTTKQGIRIEYEVGINYREIFFVLDGDFLLGYGLRSKRRPQNNVDELNTYDATLLCSNGEVSRSLYEKITNLQLDTPTSDLWELSKGLYEQRHGNFLPSDLIPESEMNVDGTDIITGTGGKIDDYIRSIIKGSQESGQWVSQQLPEYITSCKETPSNVEKSPFFIREAEGKYRLSETAIDLIAAKHLIRE